MLVKDVRKTLLCLFLVPGAFLFFGCDQNVSDDDPVPVVETIDWRVTADGKFYQYKTNDSTKYGYVFYHPSTSNALLTDEITFTVSKKSGYEDASFGVAFFYQDVNNYYRVLIDISGMYMIQQKIEGKFPEPIIQKWTSSSALLTGYNAKNKITLKNTGVGTYTLWFNDKEIRTFAVNTATLGKYCAVVCIGDADEEQFPKVSEDVYFSELSPRPFPVAANVVSRAVDYEKK